MEQLVARRAHNPKVVGSSPAPATESNSLDNTKSVRFFFAPNWLPSCQAYNSFLLFSLLNLTILIENKVKAKPN